MNAFFVGIGGMGMSGLAKILHNSGYKVAGSDRNLEGDYCKRLIEIGVKIYPQDGSGPEKFMADQNLTSQDFKIVKSTAVEDNVPDIVTARRLHLEQIMRSDLLAQMFNGKRGLAIGGTAGKTTTTGLVAWILKFGGKEPSCAVGGIISGLETNAFQGKGPHFIIEADESDGSIVKYRPWVSVVTNISRDHKTLDELVSLFTRFLDNTADDGLRLVCGEDENARQLLKTCDKKVYTYGFSETCDFVAKNVSLNNNTAKFTFEDTEFSIKLPGEHNVLNALSAIVVAQKAGMHLQDIAEAVKAFPGMKRRFEKVGSVNGVTVVDDFAHNPVEIAAAIRTARKTSNRRFIVYQPHGYGPTSFTRNDLIKVFSSLQQNEFLFLDEIFYGGGTVNRDISSEEIVAEVNRSFANAWHVSDRKELIDRISTQVKPGDMVLVMGARDINSICTKILEKIPAVKNQEKA
ncbi:MAG: UDP-N-acetylmuramate--L-alanine ligase [Candidatus Rifleibacteriota bacterium]